MFRVIFADFWGSIALRVQLAQHLLSVIPRLRLEVLRARLADGDGKVTPLVMPVGGLHLLVLFPLCLPFLLHLGLLFRPLIPYVGEVLLYLDQGL